VACVYSPVIMASSNPNPIPKPRMGTEHWALIVSITALIVSGMSLWGSHRISDIQIAQAAPRLQVRHSELVRLEKTGNPNDFTLVMYTVNTGHLLAKVREVSVQPNISTALFDDPTKKICFEDLNKQNFIDNTGLEEKIPTGIVSHLLVNVELPETCKDTGWRFFAEVTFRGRDEVDASYTGTEEILAIVPPLKP
jgi:hypothetical protein